MVTFVTLLQVELKQGKLKDFIPFFELVGSMEEGTRIGLANELDLALKFQAFVDQVPLKVDRKDPFSLKKATSSLAILEDFFIGNVFQFHKFLNFLLEAVEEAVENIFVQIK